MKTVTIDNYSLMGTDLAIGCRLIYRGITINTCVMHRSERDKLKQFMTECAIAKGFTHYKIMGQSSKPTKF